MDEVAQGAASGDVLHRKEQDAAVLALVVHRHDVGVGQSGSRARLTDEATGEGLVVGQRVRHHLDGYGPVQTKVGGLVDSGHPATSDERLDAIPLVKQLADEWVKDGRASHAGEFTDGAAVAWVASPLERRGTLGA